MGRWEETPPKRKKGDKRGEKRQGEKERKTKTAEASLFVVETEQVFDRGIKRFRKVHGKA